MIGYQTTYKELKQGANERTLQATIRSYQTTYKELKLYYV